MSAHHPRPLRGRLSAVRQQYGSSALGAPLLWFPAPAADAESGLIIAGTHGDENAGLQPYQVRCALCRRRYAATM